MSGNTNIVKGRIEEAVGALTGNEKLRARGKSDQALGQVEKTAEKAVDRAKKSAEGCVDKAIESARIEVEKARGRKA